MLLRVRNFSGEKLPGASADALQSPSEAHASKSIRWGGGNRGFTLLLAALISSIVLALGASIFALAQKEVTLSSIGRDSQFAFYTADAIAECALYWDFRFNYFATATPAGVPEPTCDGALLNATGRSETYPYTMASARVDLFQDATPIGDFCAQVSVTKSVDAGGALRTLIHADGYSVNCASVDTSPRALQRSVELRY